MCIRDRSQPSEDLAKFLRYSGANPFAVAAGFCVLFALSFLLAWKVGRVPAAAASVAAALRGSPQEGRQPLAARTAAAAVLLAVFAAAFSQVIGWPGSSQAVSYTHLDVYKRQAVDSRSAKSRGMVSMATLLSRQFQVAGSVST